MFSVPPPLPPAPHTSELSWTRGRNLVRRAQGLRDERQVPDATKTALIAISKNIILAAHIYNKHCICCRISRLFLFMDVI